MIAVIAGTGTLPIDACTSLAAQGKDFFVLSLFPEDNCEQLSTAVGASSIITLPFYKVGTILNELEARNTTELLFIGKVDKRNLFKKLSFDWLFFKLTAQVLYKSDKAMMEHMIAFLKKRNIRVLKQSDILSSLLIEPGTLAGRLTPALEKDITFGLELARTISLHDIGQTVVVKQGTILAVEAIEGTDECIKRGIRVGNKGVVICKAARSDQNKQYDLPTLGPDSLKGLEKGDVAAIAWQSKQTFIAQRDQFVAQARELGIVLVSI